MITEGEVAGSFRFHRVIPGCVANREGDDTVNIGQLARSICSIGQGEVPVAILSLSKGCGLFAYRAATIEEVGGIALGICFYGPQSGSE